MLKLKDVCKKESSNIALKDLEKMDGIYPIYGASGFIKNVDFYQQEKEYIAVVKDGAGIGRVMHLPAKSSVIGTMQYIVPDDGVNVSYLAYALEHMNLAKYYTGATIPHIYFKDYGNEPLPEYTYEVQCSIADVLDGVSRLISLRREQLSQLDQLIKSRFIEMFGDQRTNPFGWDMVTIGDIATEVRYGTSRPAVEGGKYPYLRMNNLTYEGYLNLTDLKRIDIPDNEIEKCVVRNGDVLFNRTNSVELVGKTCVYNLDYDMIIAGYNLYRKNALCKYLLSAIENQGKEQIYTGNLTIEHIMPQNQNMSTAWQVMLGNDWKAVKDKYLHTLGNLTLTAYNSELGDKPFAEKKERLACVHTKVVALYADVKDRDIWNADAIEARADNLIKEIQKLFAIEQPTVSIKFTDPRYAEYTCEYPDNATYKTPNYYILQGERVNVSNFAEMLRSLIDRLYAKDKSIIERLARKNEKILDWSQSIMFSYDVANVYGENRIKGTDIYVNVGYSAAHIMCIIKELLSIYDIDITEFVYSAKGKSDSKQGES